MKLTRIRPIIRGGIVFLVLICALVLSLVARKPATARADNSYSAKNPTPYTLILRWDSFDKNGKLSHSMEETSAVRRDGAMATIIRDTGENSTTLEFPRKAKVLLRDSKRLRSSVSTQSIPLLRDPQHSCAVPNEQPEARTGNVAGYPAVMVKGGDRTSWYAIDNGCALLQESWHFSTGEVCEKHLVSLTMGEPAATLFELPESYEEVTPSALANADCPTCAQANGSFFSIEDSYYNKHRLAALPK